MNIHELFPSKYINAEHLGTREVAVTIRVLTLESVAGQRKPVLYFEQGQKGLLLNRTNALAIARLHGDETEGWIGKRLVLFAAFTTFKGEKVKCVRVRG